MVLPTTNVYVREEGRKYLSEGHYVFAVDNKSLTEKYLLNPFWTWLTQNHIPSTIAPNLITFSGFVLMCVAFAMIWLNYPYFHFPFHQFMTLLIALFMFIYQTLDGCDGKQARRTGSSSPLGELFDHGVDAICLTIYSQSLDAMLGYSSASFPLSNLMLHIIMWTSFYAAHWEHYHTHNFFMGEISAGDGQLIIIGLFLRGSVATWLQPDLYPTIVHYYRNNTFTIPLTGGITLSYGHFWQLFAQVNGVLTIVRATLSIYFYYQSGKDKQEKNRDVSTKRHSFVNALIDFTPILFMCAQFSIWVLINQYFSAPVSHVVKAPANIASIVPDLTTVWTRDAMWFVVTGGCIFGVYLTTLNISRVTNQNFEYFSLQHIVTNAIISIQIVNSLIRVVTGKAIICEILLLKVATIFSVVYYIHFVTDVALNFSKAMNIWIFTLGKRKTQ